MKTPLASITANARASNQWATRSLRPKRAIKRAGGSAGVASAFIGRERLAHGYLNALRDL